MNKIVSIARNRKKGSGFQIFRYHIPVVIESFEFSSFFSSFFI